MSKVTVVMQNDDPLEVLSGGEESNKKYIEELEHRINEDYSNKVNPYIKYDRKNTYTKLIFVRGYEFEITNN